MKRIPLICFLPLLLMGCRAESPQVKHFSIEGRVEPTAVNIVEIPIANSYEFVSLALLDSLLFLSEWTVLGDRGVHIYSKNTFSHLASTAIAGKGPGEIAQQGRLMVDACNRCFWLSDNGKRTFWKFPLDSVLSVIDYKPLVSLSYSDTCLMDRYAFVDKNIAIGRAIKAVLPGQVQYFTSELNFTSNITSRFGYEHPGLNNKQTISYFSLSTQSQVYVMPHAKCDLMTICNLDGSLRCNVYGQDWGSPDKGKSYFGEAAISSGKIFVLYLGDAGYVRDKHERVRSNLPTKLLVFDIDGRHRATIETGHEVVSFCIDEENHRVICYFNNTEHPLGYFSFDFEKELE